MSDPVAHIKPLRGSMITGVLDDVATEIQRQDDLARAGKFGGTHILPGGPDADRLVVLVEEVGEVAKELNEERAGNPVSTGLGHHPRRGPDPGKKYDELVQTAACAVAWATAHLEELKGYRP